MDTKDGIIVVNCHEMLKYFKSFDPIKLKYGLEHSIYTNKISEKERVIYSYLEQLESVQQYSELTKIPYGEARESLDIIYDDEELSDSIIKMYDQMKNKIISQYINIDGLERLFSEKYIEFEWEMHLGIDYKRHKMDYYRDHFVHQMRNAYCIDVFLRDREDGGLGWYKWIRNVLKVSTNSKVSRYVYKSVEQQKLSGFWENAKKYLERLAGESENECCLLEGIDEDEFCYRNIIYMACYMAALFHDIGYPEVSNTQNQRRIIDYIANLYNVEASGYNYARLRALMQNSLLFRVVPFEEIQNRMMGEKPDHGVISAIIFLMNFYENGAIHRLEPYKCCAVELAALAMYNHTNSYSYKKEVGENGYVRASFLLNPISYLLRLCDDLQEWGRVYFELSHASNMIICQKCKTPVVRRRDEKGENYFYACNCNQGKEDISGIFSPMFDYRRNFPYRRIYNVCVCENLYLYSSVEKGRELVIFFLEYELDRLLHMAYINSSFACYRAKELQKLKYLLDYQFELPPMYLLYFVSANPILIKTFILYQYLEKKEWILLCKLRRSWEGIVALNGCMIEKLEAPTEFEKLSEEGYEIDLDGWQNFFGKGEYVRLNRLFTSIISKLIKKIKNEVYNVYSYDLNSLKKGNDNGYVYMDGIDGQERADNQYRSVIEVMDMGLELYVKILVIMHLCEEINCYNVKDEDILLLCWYNARAMGLDVREYRNPNLKQLIIDAVEQCSKMYKVHDFKGANGKVRRKQSSKAAKENGLNKIFGLKEKPGRYYGQFVASDYTYGCINRFVDVETYEPVSWKETLDDDGKYVDAFTDLEVFKKILLKLNEE